MQQEALFADLAPTAAALPNGFDYQPDFLTPKEERDLIEVIQTLPLQEAQYKEFTARRRVVSYGGRFDYATNELLPGAELIEALLPLRARVSLWAGLPAADLVHTLISEYSPGTPLGWHRDVPNFEHVFGVSLGGAACLRFRPYPPMQPKKADVVGMELMRRSIYAIRGASRWQWQHSVAPVSEARWSITFRTAAARRGPVTRR